MNIFCTYFELTFDRVRNILIVSFCLMGTWRILNRLRQNIPDFNSIGTFFEKDFVLIFDRIWADFEQNWTHFRQTMDRIWTYFVIIWTNFVHISNILRKDGEQNLDSFLRRFRQTLNICWSIIDDIFTFLPKAVRSFTDL